ncbi:MAG: D-cysteine desulfhydrase family protein [Ignavibacteriaceae bacterium]|nr:D-cysteine desulfhydrase family protein [Ignavibacteriaceae bacterium]
MLVDCIENIFNTGFTLQMKETIHKLNLTNLPTPLEPADSLAKYLGLSSLLIKRDDMTGLAGGGNKARKLEFELADAVSGGYDTLITIGGQQSNHARMTAAAARKLGMDVKLVLGGEDFTELKGNMLLNAMLGAEMRYIDGSDEDDDLIALMNMWMKELDSEGKKVYQLPIGGSTPLGSLGYFYAMKEISDQTGTPNLQIILPVGSCGTFAGSLLGAKVFMPEARVTGISISRKKENILERTMSLIRGSAELLGIDNPVSAEDLIILDNYHKAYAEPVKEAEEAIRTAAQLEGLILDYIYTGKVMAALFDLTARGHFDKNIPVLFLHTGGLPIVFSGKQKIPAGNICKKYSLSDIQRS